MHGFMGISMLVKKAINSWYERRPRIVTKAYQPGIAHKKLWLTVNPYEDPSRSTTIAQIDKVEDQSNMPDSSTGPRNWQEDPSGKIWWSLLIKNRAMSSDSWATSFKMSSAVGVFWPRAMDNAEEVQCSGVFQRTYYLCTGIQFGVLEPKGRTRELEISEWRELENLWAGGLFSRTKTRLD